MKKLNILWLTAIVIFFVLSGCREEIDYVTNQQQSERVDEFFKNNGVTNKNANLSLVSNHIQKIKKINKKVNFLAKISDKSGIPVWNFMIDAESRKIISIASPTKEMKKRQMF